MKIKVPILGCHQKKNVAGDFLYKEKSHTIKCFFFMDCIIYKQIIVL